jgi:hypothetical protein
MSTIDQLPHDEWRRAIESDFIELLLINGELLSALTTVVKRLESLPDAAPMDTTRFAIVHMSDRLHDLSVHFLGEHERERFTDFEHPEHKPTAP